MICIMNWISYDISMHFGERLLLKLNKVEYIKLLDKYILGNDWEGFYSLMRMYPDFFHTAGKYTHWRFSLSVLKQSLNSPWTIHWIISIVFSILHPWPWVINFLPKLTPCPWTVPWQSPVNPLTVPGPFVTMQEKSFPAVPIHKQSVATHVVNAL